MVRHGLMLVGDTCSGKTTVLHCLQKSMTKLDKQGKFNKVAVTKMNPKSITSH
jgi:dynein heavy chain